MTIFELQNTIKNALNKVEKLVQGGCKAFAEDTRTVYDEANEWISGGKVALVVVTPDFERAGSGTADGLPFEGEIRIQCIEMASLACEDTSVIRALDAAECVAHELDDQTLEWRSIRQTVDAITSTVTATVTFGYDGILTK